MHEKSGFGPSWVDKNTLDSFITKLAHNLCMKEKGYTITYTGEEVDPRKDPLLASRLGTISPTVQSSYVLNNTYWYFGRTFEILRMMVIV